MNEDNWVYKKEKDGFELNINYDNEKYCSEVIFEGKTIYSGNVSNNENKNIFSKYLNP